MPQALDVAAMQAPAGKAPRVSSAVQPSPKRLRIAYLLSRYPAVSHTFFLMEVLGLRARGLDIETVSINQPDRPINALSPQEAKEAASTLYVKDGRWFSTLVLLLKICLLHPVVLGRGIACVMEMSGLTLRNRSLWIAYLAEAMLVGHWMQRRKRTHLHVHFGGPVASVGLLVSRAWRIPYSLTIHGPEELLNTEAFQLGPKLSHAAFVFCISDFCRSQLCRITPASSWSKLIVVRLGVDPVVLAPAARNANRLHPSAASHRLHLVCTGRLVPEKGHRILLQALVLLRERSTSFHTTLIGNGPERASLEAFVRRHHLEDDVHFALALSHEETLEHVRHADIFALASFAEGIPVALMEAMALGAPCVSTAVAGIPELIRAGRDGLLVPPANVNALADALETLVQDPALRKDLAASARQRIISDYNLPLNQERLAQCLHQQISAAQRNRRKGDRQ